MVLTNELLSIGFALVTNFAAVVGTPDSAVPRKAEDLREFTAGDPASPVNLYLAHRTGTMFGIRNGAVTMYEAPGSYRHMQDPGLIPTLLGAPALNSNQVIELATRTVTALVKGTNPIANVQPAIKPAGRTLWGAEVPFYQVMWRKPKHTGGFGYFASVEVDARTGRITSLDLHDPGFYNYDLAREMMAKIYIPPTNRPAPGTTHQRTFAELFPAPSTNEVLEAVVSWRALCAMLGVTAGTNADLGSVNWDYTCIFTNVFILSETDRVCRVEFNDGIWLASLRGVVFAHHAADSYTFGNHWQPRTAEQELAFRGKINYRWEDLAQRLQDTLVKKAGVPRECFSRYTPMGPPEKSELGARVSNRYVYISWEQTPDRKFHGLTAEFDAQTGELKDVGFNDPRILKALARAQGKRL
jgi:hypothetical protein